MTTETNRPIRIVVGVDFSETGDSAVLEALKLCPPWRSAELHVVHALNRPHHVAALDALGRNLDTKLTELETRVAALMAAARVPERRRVTPLFHVRIGDPAHALQQVAVDVDADLIVVGAHVHHIAVQRWLVPSVADTLIEIAHMSVVVAQARALDRLAKTERPDPPRAVPNAPVMHPALHVHLEFVERQTHISGLI